MFDGLFFCVYFLYFSCHSNLLVDTVFFFVYYIQREVLGLHTIYATQFMQYGVIWLFIFVWISPLQFDVYKNQFYEIDHVDMIPVIAFDMEEKIQFKKKKNTNSIIKHSHLFHSFYVDAYHTCRFLCNSFQLVVQKYQRTHIHIYIWTTIEEVDYQI